MTRNLVYENIILFFLSLITIAYTFYKGIDTSFTHDESFTYNHYVNIPVRDIINYSNCPDIPNNHILNTLLMKASQPVFGSSEFALRLPNLLAHVLYLIFIVLLLKKFNNTLLIVSGFIILNFNGYMLDFFSMARGYGLSISLMMISFYWFTGFLSSRKLKYVWLSFLFGAISVWSNFTLLNYYLASFCVFFIFLPAGCITEESAFSKRIRVFIITGLPVLILSFLLYKLIAKPLETIKGNLFGPDEGFYTNTICSLVLRTTNYDVHVFTYTIATIIVCIILFSSIFYLFDLIKNKTRFFNSPNLAALLILCLSAFSTSLQNYLLKTQYLQSRTALFYIPLFNLCFVYLYSYCLANFTPQKSVHGMFSLYPVFCIIFFIYSFNIKYYRDWKYDCTTKDMMALLKTDHENSPPVNHNINLGVNWLFEPTINYYRVTKHLDWLNPVYRDGYDGDFDYYYLLDDTTYINRNKKVVLKEFPVSNAVFAKSN